MTEAVDNCSGAWANAAMSKPAEPTVPIEFEDAVMWAAWLYFADQLTQNEIAQRLGVSRATIVNYLAEAREKGIVQVQIKPETAARTALARDLAKKYGLKGVFVIPAAEEAALVDRLGDAGARVLADLLQEGDTIGVAWGRTVLAVAGKITLPKPLANLTVVQVSGSSTGERDFSAELCTSLLAQRLQARCVNLLAPAVLTTRELKAALLSEPILQRQMELVHSTDHILFGVGDVGPKATVRMSGICTEAEMDDYVARGAEAAIIGRFIDRQGRPLGGDHDARMVGISLDDLKKVGNRICLGGGPAKHAAIDATLGAGYATHFVTDSATAEALLAR